MGSDSCRIGPCFPNEWNPGKITEHLDSPPHTQYSFFFNCIQRKFLDASLGFAAGVMLAASYWSLLAPAIEMAESSGMYGQSGEYAFAPVAIGFIFGALFVYVADQLMHYFNIGSTKLIIGNLQVPHNSIEFLILNVLNLTDMNSGYYSSSSKKSRGLSAGVQPFQKSSKDGNVTKRKIKTQMADEEELSYGLSEDDDKSAKQASDKWKRILLLVIAITVHNIPGILIQQFVV